MSPVGELGIAAIARVELDVVLVGDRLRGYLDPL